MKSKIMISLICFAVATFLISGCSENNYLDTGENQQEEPAQAEEQSEKKGDYIVVDTDFGTLYYPDQWTECVEVDQATSEKAIEVSFDAVINDVQYPLFRVVIGEGDGAKVGELTDDSGETHSVYMHTEEIQEDPNLTEGEQNRLYAMQEDLNYLIDHLE